MRIFTLWSLLLLLQPLSTLAGEQEWRFRVYLDDKEIGYHDFLLRERDSERQLQSVANFEYKLLFVKLYDYLHENTETWQGDCLTQIEARTDANGKPYEVRGSLVDGRFTLQNPDGPVELPECVMSFAYWNPRFLRQDRLLNTQNGAFVEVRVSDPEPDELEVRGARLPAYRYLLEAGELVIQLWYSEDQQWLALETEARGGRTLRYELL